MSPLGSANGGGGSSESYTASASRSPGRLSGSAPHGLDYISQHAVGRVALRLRRGGDEAASHQAGALGAWFGRRGSPRGEGDRGAEVGFLTWRRLRPRLRLPARPRRLAGPLASSKVRASRLPGRGHVEPSLAQQPSEPHIPLPAVPRIRCPPPKPSSLPHSPSCLPLTATGASSGEAQVGGPQRSRNPGAFGLLCVRGEACRPSHWDHHAGLRLKVPFSVIFSGTLSRKERSLEVKASASPFFLLKPQ